MRKIVALTITAVFILSGMLRAQPSPPTDLPVKGFSIAAPFPKKVDSFLLFLNNELAPRGINTIILRVDYGFEYASHPELRGAEALSLADVKKITAAAKRHNMKIVPQINLFGHQSWANRISKLLEVYPQFDETPWINLPKTAEDYKWPNADSLYCKSYCPLHPDVHKVVFALVDELCDAFESTAFHAGLDEVFYIGMDKCPRCKGKDKAVLFAGEVKRIRDHLVSKNRELWMWGDRLLDGYTTGLGMWEASYNNTHPAIDMIPKDVVICDWHYARADKTPVYFATKGFRVISCSWNRPEVATEQYYDMLRFRAQSTPEIQARLLGMCHTTWSNFSGFLKEYYHTKTDTARRSSAETFRKTFLLPGQTREVEKNNNSERSHSKNQAPPASVSLRTIRSEEIAPGN